MADDLRQEFTIDASQALDALNNLDSAFKRLSSTLDQFKGGAFNKEGRNLNDTAASLDSGFSRATTSTRRFTTSLELLSRIVFTQAIIRGLRLIEQGAARAAREFSNFQKVLSEIQAISPDSTLGELAKSSQGLSNALNIPLLDVAKSRYDLISNGFTNAADQQAVFVAAAKLGKLGVADQSQAVDLLSTSLNAYGEDARAADKFARLFFQGANVGKFTVGELATNFGKAAPAAKSLGVEMEDLVALFSSLTVKGVSTPEAATQINALFASFIKPSKGMTEAIRNLGAASGEELIRVRGFAGAMQAVVSQTDGSSAALAKLFPNVRALRGVLTESNDGFVTINSHLKSLKGLTQEEFDLRLFERMNTDSERAGAAINKLKNAITIGLGGGLIETAAKLDRMTGKVDSLSTATENFFRVLTGHGLEDAGKAFDNFASRDIQATHDDLFKQLQAIDKIRNQVLDKAKANPTGSLPLGAKDIGDLSKILDSAFDLAKVRAYDEEVVKIIDHMRSTSQAREGANPALAEEFNKQVDALERVSRQSKVTDEDLRPILEGFQSIDEDATGVRERFSFGPELKNAARAMEDLIEKRALLKNIGASTSPDELVKASNALDQLSKASGASAQNVSGALINGANAIDTAGKSAAKAINDAAAAAARSDGGGGGGQGKALGGPIGFATGGLVPWHYLAQGGAAKGTDNIPALLSRGEYVVNARQSARFFPQLQAINAGVPPSFPSAVTNHNGINGDVTVNVSGGGTAEQTARTIVAQLQREMRRGTSKL